MSALLSLENIAVTRGGKQLMRGLTMQCRAGERWAVLGLNGSGKSSLLDVISGLLAPEQGDVRYGQITVSNTSAEQLAALRAHVSQRYSPRFAMPVKNFVQQAAKDEAHAMQWMRALDLESLVARDITQLSGGELQRALLARHLARAREVTLLDEPLTHLDPAHQQQLLQTLCSAEQAACCFIAAVHDVNWAQAFATHVLLLMCEGTKESAQAGWLAGEANDVLTAENLNAALGVNFVKVKTELGVRWIS